MKHGAAAAALLALAIVGYGHWIWNPGSIATPHSDIVAFHLGLQQELYDSVHAGRGIPFWQHDRFSGSPAFTNPQAQMLSPLHALFFVLPPAQALGPTLFLHFMVFALGLYALGCALGLRPGPSLFMGTAGLFAHKMILAAYAGWLAYLGTIAWLPLLFVALVVAVERPSRDRILQAAVVGLLLLQTGMVQLIFYSCFFVAAVLLARRARRAALLLAAGGALGLGLAAVQLLPFLAEVGLYGRGKLDYQQFLAGHGSARQLLTLFWPDALGTPLTDKTLELWEDSAHLGFAVLPLAILGSFEKRWGLLLAALFAASLLLSIDTPLLHALFSVLPGMDRFRIPSRLLFLSLLFGIALAGLGLSRLRWRWLPALGIALAAAQGIYDERRYFAHAQPEALEPHPAYVRELEHAWRVAPLFRSTINPGWAAGLKLELVTGYDPLTLRRYQRFFQLLRSGSPTLPAYRGNWTDLDSIARPDLLDALSVSHVVAPSAAHLPKQPLAQFPAQPVFVFYSGLQRRDLSVYQNERVLPRAWFPEGVLAAPDEESAAAVLSRLDARRAAVVEGLAADQQFGPGRPVESLDRVSTEERRFLLLSEIFHPGWTALLDGEPAQLFPTDVALMGLFVPPGEHRVELRFRPLFFDVALWISAVSALLLAAVAIRRGGA
jgi:hypothetical protein